MTDYSDYTTAASALSDPQLSGADLAAIVQFQPSLWASVARHRNTYPDLLAWLNQNGDQVTHDAVQTRWADESYRRWWAQMAAAAPPAPRQAPIPAPPRY